MAQSPCHPRNMQPHAYKYVPPLHRTSQQLLLELQTERYCCHYLYLIEFHPLWPKICCLCLLRSIYLYNKLSGVIFIIMHLHLHLHLLLCCLMFVGFLGQPKMVQVLVFRILAVVMATNSLLTEENIALGFHLPAGGVHEAVSSHCRSFYRKAI